MQAEAYKGQGDRNRLRNIGSILRREGVYDVLVEESRVWVRLGVEGEFVVPVWTWAVLAGAAPSQAAKQA
jgi:hypothetical protein